MTTTNMSLNEPSVGVTTGPDWATQVNENFETIDNHDHTSGKGVQLTPSALNINADLEFNSNAAIELKRLTFDSGATGSGTNYSVYQQGGNLYWYNGSGQAVQITNGASVKTTGGSIDGMSGTDAQVLFGSGIYRFEFDTTLTPFSGSKMAHADILLYKYDGLSGSDAYVILKYTGSSAGSNNITVPDETGTMLTTSTSYGGNISIAATGGSNTITLDAEGDINLDAQSGILNFKDGGTAIGKISADQSNLVIENEVDAKDIIFRQYDGNEVVRMADDRRLYFYDKGGEYLVGDGANLTVASGGALNLTASTDVVVPANVGITFGTGEKIEGDNTDLTLTSGADINLTATADVNLPNNVGLVFGDDGEKIEGDGTDLTIASSATLNVNTGSSSGNDLKVNTSQLVVEGDTGRVGVGTATPSQQIHISGATPIIQMTDTDTGADSLITASNATGSLKIQCDNNNETGSSTFEVDIDGSQRMKVDSTGDMTITDGDLVFGGAGHGVYLGVTTATAANLLDDYEEGTFDPSVNATISSYASRSGHYVKIGQLVTVTGYIQMTKGSDSSTSTLQFNLPFTVINTGAGSGFGEGGGSTNITRASNFSANTPNNISFSDGQPYGLLYDGLTPTKRTDVSTDSLFYFSLQYFTTT
jgi:hypothetical protein